MQQKECWQLKSGEPTPCFMQAGGIPCSGADCLVGAALERTRITLQEDLRGLFLHTECRMSVLSRDNDEWRERVDR